MNNNNHDNRIVLNPSLITSTNIVSPCSATNPNDGHCNTETLIDLEGDLSTLIPQSTEQCAVVTNDDGLSHQIIRPLFNEPNTLYRNGSILQAALLSREYDAYSNFRYSPPPPYDLCQTPNHSTVQTTPYPSQVLHFPQQQNMQYLHQQRLQYHQRESWQYHDEMSDYPQSQRMPYPYRREGNFPALFEQPPPFECLNCNKCLMVDTMCCCFSVLPICLLVFILYFFIH